MSPCFCNVHRSAWSYKQLLILHMQWHKDSHMAVAAVNLWIPHLFVQPILDCPLSQRSLASTSASRSLALTLASKTSVLGLEDLCPWPRRPPSLALKTTGLGLEDLCPWPWRLLALASKTYVLCLEDHCPWPRRPMSLASKTSILGLDDLCPWPWRPLALASKMLSSNTSVIILTDKWARLWSYSEGQIISCQPSCSSHSSCCRVCWCLSLSVQTCAQWTRTVSADWSRARRALLVPISLWTAAYNAVLVGST